MPKWNDFGNIWTTLRELDVSAIRTEAERPFSIACVGQLAAVDTVNQLLHRGADHYGPTGLDPVETITLDQIAARTSAIRSAQLLLLCLNTQDTQSAPNADAFAQIERLGVPALVVMLRGAQLTNGLSLPRSVAASSIVIPDPDALDASEKLAVAVFDRLPGELHLAAARLLPGLRNTYTRELIQSTSFSNATYALTTSVPEQVPILNVPFALADIVVLTKNQALMVYRMALGYGAPPDFQDRIRELAPVIGGGFVWRQLARTLVSLVPIWGVIPKLAIAYAGTYATGVAAWRWFAYGEILSPDQIRKITNDAMGIGRAKAKELLDRARQMQPKRNNPQLPEPGETSVSQPHKPSLQERVRGMLPGRNKQKPVAEDTTEQ